MKRMIGVAAGAAIVMAFGATAQTARAEAVSPSDNFDYGGFSLEFGAGWHEQEFDFVDPGKPSQDLSGASANFGLAYMHDFGKWVVGGKILLTLANTATGSFDGDFIYQTSTFEGSAGIRGVVGYQLGDALLSVEAGPAWGSFETTQECRRVIPRGYCSRAGGPNGFLAETTETIPGFTVALGFEYPISQNFTLGLRLERTRYEEQEYDLGEDGVGGQIPITTVAENDQDSVNIVGRWLLN